MNAPADVVVAVPAHNEQQDIVRCLESVQVSASHARMTGVVGRVLIAVAAHRCTDRSAEEALVALSRYDGPFLLSTDHRSETVGAVRARLLDQLSARHYVGDRTWVLNTDADSQVPRTWIADIIRRTGGPGHPVAMAGLVELSDWKPSDSARVAYAHIIAAGIHGETHDHVYGANLAVRWDAYRDVGGFRSLPHGEDHDLVDRLRARGLMVASTFTPTVRTSGRSPGRVEHGLGALLGRLEHLGVQVPEGRTNGQFVG